MSKFFCFICHQHKHVVKETYFGNELVYVCPDCERSLHTVSKANESNRIVAENVRRGKRKK